MRLTITLQESYNDVISLYFSLKTGNFHYFETTADY